MFFNRILYGTQYYRAPTPLPEEWEADFRKAAELNLEPLQIRLQWRQNEKKENEYHFDDVDALFALARKYERSVMIKFLLENAPQYVFDKYGGTRRDFFGAPIQPGLNGAFYVGGWMPCFDNPMVVERARQFVRVVVDRYKDEPHLLLWNVWNEPRTRPAGDCCCEHSRRLFRAHMRDTYKTIDSFNQLFGTAEEDFDTLQTPGMPHGYWDFFLYQKWRATAALANQLRFVYDAVRELDPKRPIMSHTGGSPITQSTFEDGGDDFTLSKTVDFYGTSYFLDRSADEASKRYGRMYGQLKCDYSRSIDENYFVHEMYADYGHGFPEVPASHLRYRIWNTLARGAKGIVYWQMRPERVGNESDLCGFVNMDGSDKRLTREVGHIGGVLRKHKDIFIQASCKKAEVAIIFDYDSCLLSQIEDCGAIFTFDVSKNPTKNHYRTLIGMYKLFYDLNVDVDFIDSREIGKMHEYKVAYFPYAAMLNPRVEDTLMGYRGVLLLDEGFGLRSQNTWLQPNKTSFDRLLDNARWYHRVWAQGEKLSIDGKEVTAAPYVTQFAYDGKDVDDKGYIKMKNNLYLFGTSVGFSYFTHGEEGWLSFISGILNRQQVARNRDFGIRGLKTLTLTCGKKELCYFFNWSGAAQSIALDFEWDMELIEQSEVRDSRLLLEDGHVACFLCKPRCP